MEERGKEPGATARELPDDAETLVWRRPAEVPSGATEDDGATQFFSSAPVVSDDAATIFQPSTARESLLEEDSGTVGQAQRASRGDHAASVRELTLTPDTAAHKDGVASVPKAGDTVLDGRFLLLEELIHGAQAYAYKAKDLVSDAIVFVKVSRERDPGEGAFLRQIALRDRLLQLSNRHLLRCLNLEVSDGRLIEVFEYLDGGPLSEWLRIKPRLPDDEIRSLVVQLAEGIRALQEEGGLVHRDIKPTNVFVQTTEAPFLLKIVDYGLACRIGAGGLSPVEGTRFYSPPECLARHVANDEVLRSWDWWSLGRVVQDVVDGSGLEQRLTELQRHLPQETRRDHRSEREALQFIFDEVLREQDRDKYHVRAGMVELSEKMPGSARWIALMKGLLTTKRASRWGHKDVVSFLAGRAVREAYAVSADAETLEFDGGFWELSALALHLRERSARSSDHFLVEDSRDAWDETKKLVRGGRILRYVKDILRDVDLDAAISPLIAIEDRSLATALTVLRLAEIDEPPLIRSAVVNRRMAFELAESRHPPAAKMLATLLSRSYIDLHTRVHSQSGADLAALVREMAGMRGRLSEVGVRDTKGATTFSDQQLLKMMGTAETDARDAIQTFKVSFGRTDNPKLATLFGQDGETASATDVRVLLLALAAPSANRFVSNQVIAEELARRAKNVRTAAALNRAASLLGGRSPFVMGEVKTRFFVFLFVSVSVILLLYVPFRAIFLQSPMFWFICVLFAAGFAVGKLLVIRGVQKDLRTLDPDLLAVSSRSSAALLERARQWNGAPATNYRQLMTELDRVNGRIRSIPGVDLSQLPQTPVPLTWARRAQAGQVALVIALGLLSAGGGLAAKLDADDKSRYFAETHPQALFVQDGRKVYRASDLQKASSASRGFLRSLDVEGNVLILGNLDRVRLSSNRADLLIQGDVRSSVIEVGDGKVTAGSVSVGTGIKIKREGTVTIADVSHSTIMAKHIVARNVDNSALLGETVKVSGSSGKNDVSKHPWRNMP